MQSWSQSTTYGWRGIFFAAKYCKQNFMNSIIIYGGLKQTTGKVKQALGHLTHSNKLYLSGMRDQWLGKAIKLYGRLQDKFQHVFH